MGKPKRKTRKTKSRAQLANLAEARRVLAAVTPGKAPSHPPASVDNSANNSRNFSATTSRLAAKVREYQTSFWNERRKRGRAQEAKENMKTTLKATEKENKELHEKVEQVEKERTRVEEERDVAQGKLAETRGALSNLRSSMRNLRKRAMRVTGIKQNAVNRTREKTKKELANVRLKEGGRYTDGTREMVREMMACGVPESKVGHLLKGVGERLGLTINKSDVMSEGTARRIGVEGGVLAEMQLGYELAQAKAMFQIITYQNSTSHKNIEYESRHVAYRPPQYTKPGALESQPTLPSSATEHHTGNWVQRSLGVDTSVDHSSETQHAGLKERLGQISETFENSPLATRHGLKFQPDDFIYKARGSNGDHAADQKKNHKISRSWKEEVTETRIGTEAVLALPVPERLAELAKRKVEAIDSIGGVDAWEALSEREQDLVNAEILRTFGREKMAEMDEEDQRQLTLFIRTGCCMHKDLNTVKGGDEAMKAWWVTSGNTPPIILPNKDNAAVINLAKNLDNPTKAEKRALESSKRGATWLTILAAMIFKHKDTKRGQQDSHSWWMYKRIGHGLPFADVSNTRYGSHGEASCLLIVYRIHYIAFMDHLQDAKDTVTNVELNVKTALSTCLSTLTELSVHALYHVLISIPFMAYVRTHENILLLGPFFARKLQLMREVINNPNLWIGENPDPKTALLEGTQFSEWALMVLGSVKALIPTLPHFLGALIAFLEGTYTTFERFTEEFRDEGEIAGLSNEQRHYLFLPSTNDVNEGALGKLRLNKRLRPNQTLQAFNSRQLYVWNKTATFTDSVLKPEDHQYARHLARKRQVSGHSRKIRQRHNEAKERKAAENRQKNAKKKERERLRKAEVEATGKSLVIADAALDKLNVAEIRKQLQ
ncbi:hypothetical protein NMY22_g17609 [Coprinellus aureogranulatus]|nr:hypothetical protein NMY22_g17609 [Coprinellus aureogranulatus]